MAHTLLIPDYLSYRLTGNMNWEYANATTTRLVNINTDGWDETLLAGPALQQPSQFGTPAHPGNANPVTGFARRMKSQWSPSPVDTASAVIASPLAR